MAVVVDQRTTAAGKRVFFEDGDGMASTSEAGGESGAAGTCTDDDDSLVGFAGRGVQVGVDAG